MFKVMIIFLFGASTLAFASTDPNQVDQMDLAREGNLRQLVIAEFTAKYKVPCDDPNNAIKTEAIKLQSGSAHQTKKPGTPYDYEATYLVIQKCLSGSTFAGAYSDPVKSSLIRGEFHANYDKNGGPAKMDDLKLIFVNDVIIPLSAN